MQSQPPAQPSLRGAGSSAHHDAAAVQVVPWDEGLQCVQEGHASRNVKSKFHCLHLVHHEVCREGGGHWGSLRNEWHAWKGGSDGSTRTGACRL